MTPHEQLPASYMASCEEFFKWLKDCKRTGFKAPSNKRQAASNKQQATSNKQQATSNKQQALDKPGL